MEMLMGDWDETAEVRQQERARQAAQRRETCEAQRLLEHYSRPEDQFEEVAAEDAYHDQQMALYRSLARQSGWLLQDLR